MKEDDIFETKHTSFKALIRKEIIRHIFIKHVGIVL